MRIEGESELPGKSNYLLGADAGNWRTNIPTFAKIRYRQIWPGVDAVFYGNPQQLEYDFVVAPGADLRAVKLEFEGAQKLRLEGMGDLIVSLQDGELLQRKPIAWQMVAGTRRRVETRIHVHGNQLTFHVEDYDRTRELVIDPVLNYAARVVVGESIAVDAQGAAYIASNLAVKDKESDVLITKINPEGTQQVFSTLIGGLDAESGKGIAVDGQGSVYVTGSTVSTDFPGAFPGALAGASSGVIFKTMDGAANWGYSGKGLPAGTVNSLVVDPNNPQTIFIGLGGDSRKNLPPYKSADGGKTWSPLPLPNSARPQAVAPGNSNLVFAVSTGGLYKSLDGGLSWELAGFSNRNVFTFLIDPKNAMNCFVVVEGSVYKSLDGAKTWMFASMGLPERGVIQFVAAPDSATALYVTTAQGIFRSTNAAMTWEVANTDLNPNSLSVAWGNSSILYAGTGKGILKSTDSGSSFQKLGLEEYSLGPIVLDPMNSSTIYVSAHSRCDPSPFGCAASSVNFRGAVFTSKDGGVTWFTADNLLKQVQTYHLVIDPLSPATLYAGTASNVEMFITKLKPAGDGVVYSTLLGGPGADWGNAIVLDSMGNAYVTGLMESPPLGMEKSAFQNILSRGFVARLNSQGDSFTFFTDLPGVGNDLAVDRTGKIFVSGIAYSAFPIKDGYQSQSRGSADAFLVKFDPQKNTEDSVLYSTLLGGEETDEAQALALGFNGYAVLSGTTSSKRFPLTANPLRSQPGETFLAAIDTNKTGQASLVWSSFFSAKTVRDLAVDGQNNLYLVGAANTGFSVTPGAYQATFAGGDCGRIPVCVPPPLNCRCGDISCSSPTSYITFFCDDAFVSKVSPDGGLLLNSTYLGANQREVANGLALDAAGNALVAGLGALNVTPGSLQMPGTTGFLMKLSLDSRAGTIASVSAASYIGSQLAQESLATGFLDAFGAGADSLKVQVGDSAGAVREAQVFYSGAGQVNYQIPPETALGTATIRITNGGVAIASGAVQIVPVAPGIFAANANGRGVAAAVAQRVKADNSQIFEAIAAYDQTLKQFVSTPIDLGPESDQVYLALFGTGLRFRTTQSAVKVTIGGIDVPVLYADRQPTLIGVDQINVRLPRTLLGKGEIDLVLSVDGKTANTVKVNFK